MGLDLDTLRKANIARLPQFKASTGAPAHSSKDGSDWSPAEWLQAFFGEVGEFAEIRTQYECGLISQDEYREQAAKELADIQTYLDILARRAFDRLEQFNSSHNPFPGQGCPLFDSPAQHLMHVIACLGSYANARKKLQRGDFKGREQDYHLAAKEHLQSAAWEMTQLVKAAEDVETSPADKVDFAHHEGVDLGRATIDKFNQVSQRVGSTIYIELADGRSQLHVEP